MEFLENLSQLSHSWNQTSSRIRMRDPKVLSKKSARKRLGMVRRGAERCSCSKVPRSKVPLACVNPGTLGTLGTFEGATYIPYIRPRGRRCPRRHIYMEPVAPSAGRRLPGHPNRWHLRELKPSHQPTCNRPGRSLTGGDLVTARIWIVAATAWVLKGDLSEVTTRINTTRGPV